MRLREVGDVVMLGGLKKRERLGVSGALGWGGGVERTRQLWMEG